ncbi:MAG: hypothetical protein A2255_10530 [Candidatus Melainabacteria bacterium RIFOXYA2_FULL_32_9]|nr:MAG: hypothetical protein A2255_10530 [Candidatus Melainabacteria bacterium RIFOXYA2_FULL_32_9]
MINDDDDQIRRWYDKDPILSKAVNILETSSDNLQIQIALNLITVIIEHNIDNNTYSSVDEIIASADDEKEFGSNRWYDLDDTLKTAIQLLKTCSNELRGKLAEDIAAIVTEALNNVDSEEALDI